MSPSRHATYVFLATSASPNQYVTDNDDRLDTDAQRDHLHTDAQCDSLDAGAQRDLIDELSLEQDPAGVLVGTTSVASLTCSPRNDL